MTTSKTASAATAAPRLTRKKLVAIATLGLLSIAAIQYAPHAEARGGSHFSGGRASGGHWSGGGGHWRGGRWFGPAIGAAIIGGAIAGSYYYGPNYYGPNYYGPAYYPPGYYDPNAYPPGPPQYIEQGDGAYSPSSAPYGSAPPPQPAYAAPQQGYAPAPQGYAQQAAPQGYSQQGYAPQGAQAPQSIEQELRDLKAACDRRQIGAEECRARRAELLQQM